MATSDPARPTAIRAPHGATVLEIAWSNGELSRVPHWILRGFCPCAGCQGHEGPLAFVPATDGLGRAGLEIRELRRVGNYALQFTWGDGHEAGIYTFEHLRWLGQQATLAPEDVKARSSGR